MIKIDQIFSTPFFTAEIDPKSFNKQEIIDTVITNYSKNPYQNAWDGTESNLHHYYNNEIQEKFNLNPLYAVYKDIISNIFGHLFSFPMDYVYNLANITAYRSHQHMKVHDHVGTHGFLSGVHYLKVPKKCAPLKLYNPLVFSQYPTTVNETLSKKIKNKKSSPLLSSFIRDIDYVPKEDQIVFFPAYLKHAVYPISHEKDDSDELRIAAVINVLIGDGIPVQND